MVGTVAHVVILLALSLHAAPFYRLLGALRGFACAVRSEGLRVRVRCLHSVRSVCFYMAIHGCCFARFACCLSVLLAMAT